MKPDEASAVCQSCHKAGEQFHWDQSAHARNDVACASATASTPPRAGRGQLLTASDVEHCVTCHKDKRAELAHAAPHADPRGQHDLRRLPQSARLAPGRT